jgi:asparagine synthase (glutamine-hydrolysing)
MRALNEKALLKRAMRGRLPPTILARSKQPYRGPGPDSFLGERGREIASTLLNRQRVEAAGCFGFDGVSRLRGKVEKGARLGERDSMAYIGILATQAWHYWFAEGHAVQSEPSRQDVVSAKVEV